MSLNKLPAEVEFLMQAVRSAPSADNTQPWCFEWANSTITCQVYRRGGFPADYHAVQFSLGAAAENLIQAAQFLNLDITSWYLNVPGEDGIFARGLVERKDIAIPSIMPLWKLRHTNRLPYHLEIEAGVDHQLEACHVENIRVKVIAGSGIQQASGWIRQASEIRFQTREVNEWFAASLRYGNSQEEMNYGLHVNTLALPSGGVELLKLMSDWNRMQWLNRIWAYKLFAAIESANFRKAPLVVAIVGPTDKTAVFDAGRCLQRVWLRITELGLSAQPYYVVSDLLNRVRSNSVPAQCKSKALELKEYIHSELYPNETLHCLLRVGKPVGNVQASGRLSLEDLICNSINRRS